MEMPEDWKEKERRLLREEKIEHMREKIDQVFKNRSEEFKEARLKEQTQKIDNDSSINYVFGDIWMTDLMKKKYGPDFLTYVSTPEKPMFSAGYTCTFCHPEPEFATYKLLMKHIEVVHPENDTSPWN